MDWGIERRREGEPLVVAAGGSPAAWRAVRHALAGELPCAYAVDIRGVLDLLDREPKGIAVLCSDLLDATKEECLDRMEAAGTTRRVVVVECGRGADQVSQSDAIRIRESALSCDLLPAIRALGRAAGEENVRRGCRGKPRPGSGLEDFPAYRPMILGKSRAMHRVAEMIRRVARVDVTVLLMGESGTGKELFARRIHCMSERARGPFRSVSLPAVPGTLFESVLFGHEAGAFTGAVGRSQGAFEQACGGTLFLDEVSSLPLDAQPKLLRAIQEKEIERVGGRGPAACDIRFVAATNQDLRELVARQEYREDLYHRLAVVTIEIPPLRQRSEDIPELVEFFLAKYAEAFRCEIPRVSGSAMQALQRHPWAGNVRELENRTQRALLFGAAGGGDLEPEDFLGDVASETCAPTVCFQRCDLSLAELEQAYICEVLARFDGNQSRAAQTLEIDRKTLRAKLRKPTLHARSGKSGKGPLRAVSG